MHLFLVQLLTTLFMLVPLYCAMSFTAAALQSRYHPENRTNGWCVSQYIDLALVSVCFTKADWEYRGCLALAVLAGLVIAVVVHAHETAPEKLLPDGQRVKQVTRTGLVATLVWCLLVLGTVLYLVWLVHAAAVKL